MKMANTNFWKSVVFLVFLSAPFTLFNGRADAQDEPTTAGESLPVIPPTCDANIEPPTARHLGEVPAAGEAVPANKAQVEAWFNKIVGPLESRKATLDPALVEAEAAPKIVTVKAGGGGDFKTVAEAVASVPEQNKQRVIIKIAPGNYTERVKIPYTKPFVTLMGSDPKNMPVIVSAATAKQFGTIDSATVILEGDYFVLANIIFVNSAPRPDGQLTGGQALALRLGGDKGAVYNCKLHGFQDTLCDHKGMHLIKDTYIEGTVDFIFGKGKSIYLNNEIHVIPGETQCWITAQARMGTEDTGFSFLHGSITGTGANAYLGRSWMPYARTVFAYTDMTDVVHPKGWSDNFHPDTQQTAFFAEFNCKGAGAEPKERVPWMKKLTADQMKPFLTLDYIQASKWLLPPPKP